MWKRQHVSLDAADMAGSSRLGIASCQLLQHQMGPDRPPGGMTMSVPIMRAASADDVGRSCPYCRFAFKEGTEVTVCGICNAAHHADCWSDNGGCSIMGCEGAPSAGAGSTSTPEPRPPAPP